MVCNSNSQSNLNKPAKTNGKDKIILINRKFKAEFILADKLYTFFLRQLTEKPEK